MVKIRASFSSSGENFSPAKFSKINSVKLVDANEPGDIGRRGRHRGKPIPYGSATIEVSDKAEGNWSSFDDLLTVMENCIDDLRGAGAGDISLLVSLFHDGQCNFAFSNDQLKRLVGLNVDLPISCYSDEMLE